MNYINNGISTISEPAITCGAVGFTALGVDRGIGGCKFIGNIKQRRAEKAAKKADKSDKKE